MKPLNFTIQVDCREPRELKDNLHILGVEKGFATEEKQLLVGDYVCNNVCIERKAIGDFVSSMMKNKLSEQCQAMKQNYETNYLIIEGHFANVKSEINRNCFTGKKVSLLANHGIKIMPTEDATETVYAIYGICKENLKEDHTEITVLKKGNFSDYDVMTNALAMLRRENGTTLGFAKAQTIVKDFGISCFSDLQEPTELFNGVSDCSYEWFRKIGRLKRVSKEDWALVCRFC